MTIRTLMNKLFSLQMELNHLNQNTMETCKFGDDEETIKVWKAINQAMASVEEARALIHQNK